MQLSSTTRLSGCLFKHFSCYGFCKSTRTNLTPTLPPGHGVSSLLGTCESTKIFIAADILWQMSSNVCICSLGYVCSIRAVSLIWSRLWSLTHHIFFIRVLHIHYFTWKHVFTAKLDTFPTMLFKNTLPTLSYSLVLKGGCSLICYHSAVLFLLMNF